LRISPLVLEPGSVEADWVTGASVMFRSEALRQCGLFDDGFFLYYEEVELMWRLKKAGWRILHVPESKVLHIGAASTGLNDIGVDKQLPPYWFRSRLRFFTLSYGSMAGICANVAWLFGFTLCLARSLLRRGSSGTNLQELKGMIRNGLLPTREDRLPSVVSATAPSDVPPAWSRYDDG
jgi:GT2 family glycosyltransferase